MREFSQAKEIDGHVIQIIRMYRESQSICIPGPAKTKVVFLHNMMRKCIVKAIVYKDSRCQGYAREANYIHIPHSVYIADGW